jgi:hypothetical protein
VPKFGLTVPTGPAVGATPIHSEPGIAAAQVGVTPVNAKLVPIFVEKLKGAGAVVEV